MRAAPLLAASILFLSAACGKEGSVGGYDELSAYVTGNRVGEDADQWIEMKNLSGEWERVGLIFGYHGDQEECLKAAAGLKQANFSREYRCTPAN